MTASHTSPADTATKKASIDYLRYLERCIVDLKAANGTVSRQTESPPELSRNMRVETEEAGEAMEHDSDSDEDMSEDNGDRLPNRAPSPKSLPQFPALPSINQMTARAPSPSFAPINQHQHQQTTASSSMHPTNHHQQRHYSMSSTSQASFSPYLHSSQASPFFGPSYLNQDPAAFALTSPALRAQDAGSSHGGIAQLPTLSDAARHQRERREQDLDHEATAALLMLNSDRRSWKGKSVRGLSVNDLLSGN